MDNSNTPIIKNVLPDPSSGEVNNVDHLVAAFFAACQPLEKEMYIFVDARTNARYCECHISANTLINLSTTDVPLDPEEQPEYRANREIVTSHQAFDAMKSDAIKRRSFSNIVLEYNTEYVLESPLKIIGGQHRFEAIKLAQGREINEHHGIKVYFGLTAEQRLDAQLTSNTVIAVSTDLFDRMQETVKGPDLRNWCQRIGLLEEGQDFADKRQRGMQITVRAARTFILNYYRGQSVSSQRFASTDTTPSVCKSGQTDHEWEGIRNSHPDLWKDTGLEYAGRRFSSLILTQRKAFAKNSTGRRDSKNVDYEEKALNFAILSSWAFVAGLLQGNEARLLRHYDLDSVKNRDPLNATALAKGRHKTDPENYRGLGYRTDAKERGRLVELFYLQADKGDGITSSLIDIAIKKHHLKQAQLEVAAAEEDEE